MSDIVYRKDGTDEIMDAEGIHIELRNETCNVTSTWSSVPLSRLILERRYYVTYFGKFIGELTKEPTPGEICLNGERWVKEYRVPLEAHEISKWIALLGE